MDKEMLECWDKAKRDDSDGWMIGMDNKCWNAEIWGCKKRFLCLCGSVGSVAKNMIGHRIHRKTQTKQEDRGRMSEESNAGILACWDAGIKVKRDDSDGWMIGMKRNA